MKMSLSLAVLVSLMYLLHGRANAAAEICPATLDAAPQRVAAGVYEYRLSAMSDRSVTGIIRLQTPSGWYNAVFTGVKLHQKPAQTINDDQVQLSMLNALVSDPQYVKLPSDVPVSYAYVSQAQASGETVFGWDKAGVMPCEPIPQTQLNPAADPAAAPASSTVIAQAHAIDTQFTTTCEKPFAQLKPSSSPQLQLPAMFQNMYTQPPGGTTIVAVAADNKGGIIDAWVWQPSGTPALDQAAVSEARRSTYAPARAFCRSVSDYYLFRVNWGN